MITVCDNAKDVCSVFAGGATYLHWSFSDPAAQEGDEAERLESFRTMFVITRKTCAQCLLEGLRICTGVFRIRRRRRAMRRNFWNRAYSNDADQSIRSDADQFGDKQRRAYSE